MDVVVAITGDNVVVDGDIVVAIVDVCVSDDDDDDDDDVVADNTDEIDANEFNITPVGENVLS